MEYHKLNELIDWTTSQLQEGKQIHIDNLPSLTITDVHVVSSEVEQLALVVQEGDACIRTDESKSYIALNSDNENMNDWQEFLTAVDPSTVDHNLLKNYEANRHKEIDYDSDYRCFKVSD